MSSAEMQLKQSPQKILKYYIPLQRRSIYNGKRLEETTAAAKIHIWQDGAIETLQRFQNNNNNSIDNIESKKSINKKVSPRNLVNQ